MFKLILQPVRAISSPESSLLVQSANTICRPVRHPNTTLTLTIASVSTTASGARERRTLIRHHLNHCSDGGGGGGGFPNTARLSLARVSSAKHFDDRASAAAAAKPVRIMAENLLIRTPNLYIYYVEHVRSRSRRNVINSLVSAARLICA